jgi:hypothetical protein
MSDRLTAFLVTALLIYTTSAFESHAGGLLGDMVNSVAPGVGTALDGLHDQIKNTIEPYKQLEEGASHAINEAVVQSTAPLLQELIARSRDDALGAGVQPIPSAIRANLQGFTPDHLLNLVRFRVRGGGDLSLQANSIRYGEASAITLDYVIVFANANDALYNPVLWAHEMKHIEQYQQWGLRDFAIRYVRSYTAVEREAYDNEGLYMAWSARRNIQSASQSIPLPAEINRPVELFPQGAVSNMCGTIAGQCQVNGQAPVGTPCWCGTPMGNAFGALIPTQLPVSMPAPVPMGLPSGTVMQGCGCWGPAPVPVAPEGRCISQRVIIQACAAFCVPGMPAYGYVCQ